MTHPPDPKTNRAALAGSPVSYNQDLHNQNPTAPATLQAEKLRRLYSFCHATAAEIARLAFGVCR
jgi:hypothetical protein